MPSRSAKRMTQPAFMPPHPVQCLPKAQQFIAFRGRKARERSDSPDGLQGRVSAKRRGRSDLPMATSAIAHYESDIMRLRRYAG